MQGQYCFLKVRERAVVSLLWLDLWQLFIAGPHCFFLECLQSPVCISSSSEFQTLTCRTHSCQGLPDIRVIPYHMCSAEKRGHSSLAPFLSTKVTLQIQRQYLLRADFCAVIQRNEHMYLLTRFPFWETTMGNPPPQADGKCQQISIAKKVQQKTIVESNF